MKIKTPSRIHITLIDLNGSIGRIDGGVGIALNEPFVEIEFRESDVVKVDGKAMNLNRFEQVANKFSSKFNKGIEIEVLSDYHDHVGLGSGTQITLAVGMAFNKLYNLNLSVEEIAEIGGRGGTSGIGVNAFKVGGFIVDGGHSKKIKANFLPSSASKAKPAPIIARHDFPDWKIVVGIPELKGFYGRKEIDLFQTYCPIPLNEVQGLCHLILMKMLPSVVEKDLDEFSEALREIQHLGFKKVEIDQYNDLIWGILEYLKGYAIGMSSTGPAVFVVVDSNAKVVEKGIENYFKDYNLNCATFITKAKNRGAEIV
ncbi:hypothetical protein DRO97_04890 [Archaeoglobales archaeon]|nr:MAG: hypothetical protein DRO97_04890 [Archaeoglobales archaeon]